MNTVQFLEQLNDAEKGWGLWLDRNNPAEHHVGQYAFENDRMPKNFVHVASLDSLAHQRQTYIMNNSSLEKSEELLGHEWAEQFIAEWQSQPVGV